MNFGMGNFSYCGIYPAKLEFSNFSSLENITLKNTRLTKETSHRTRIFIPGKRI